MNRSDDSNRSATGERGSISSKSSQMEDKQSQGGKEHGSASQRAEDQKAGAKGERNAQDNSRSDKSKSLSSETERQNGNMKAEGRNGTNMNAESREGRSGNMNAETRTNERSTTTVGQAWDTWDSMVLTLAIAILSILLSHRYPRQEASPAP